MFVFIFPVYVEIMLEDTTLGLEWVETSIEG